MRTGLVSLTVGRHYRSGGVWSQDMETQQMVKSSIGDPKLAKSKVISFPPAQLAGFAGQPYTVL